MASIDSLHTRRDLKVGRKKYAYYSLRAAEEAGLATAGADFQAIAAWIENRGATHHEISFRPARVLMQDFTGVPAVVDLAAMRDAMAALGADPEKINPLNPVDLVIDHSVMVD